MTAMASTFFSTLFSASAAGATGAAGAGAVAGAAGTAAGGSAGIGLSTIGSILQGTATLMGIMSGMDSANIEADNLELQALDAETEKSNELLQGIERRGSINRALLDAIGAQDVAYAASGSDSSFGTAKIARGEAFREADTALSSSNATETSRMSRLTERARNYRNMARKSRKSGKTQAVTKGLGALGNILQRG
jgi:hypothetical protein